MTPNEREALAPCPWCGEAPTSEEDVDGRNTEVGRWSVGCFSETCAMHMVEVWGRDQADAEARWNRRRSPSREALLAEGRRLGLVEGLEEAAVLVENMAGRGGGERGGAGFFINAIRALKSEPGVPEGGAPTEGPCFSPVWNRGRFDGYCIKKPRHEGPCWPFDRPEPAPVTPTHRPLSQSERGPGEVHLKCWPSEFMDIEAGVKTFEFRLDDRGYAVGDVLCLREWNPNTKSYTGKELSRRVTSLLRGRFGVPDGYVVMSLATPPPAVPMGDLPETTVELVAELTRERDAAKERERAALIDFINGPYEYKGDEQGWENWVLTPRDNLKDLRDTFDVGTLADSICVDIVKAIEEHKHLPADPAASQEGTQGRGEVDRG